MSNSETSDADYMKAFIKSSLIRSKQPVNFENFVQDFENEEYYEYYNDRQYYHLLYEHDTDVHKSEHFDTDPDVGKRFDTLGENGVTYLLKYGENKKYFMHFLPLVDYVLTNGLVDQEFTIEKL